MRCFKENSEYKKLLDDSQKSQDQSDKDSTQYQDQHENHNSQEAVQNPGSHGYISFHFQIVSYKILKIRGSSELAIWKSTNSCITPTTYIHGRFRNA